MLISKLHNKSLNEIQNIYNILWNGNFKREDEEKHIIIYIIQFYKLRAFGDCRNKCHTLLKAIKN